jgi:hypothetical protein
MSYPGITKILTAKKKKRVQGSEEESVVDNVQEEAEVDVPIPVSVNPQVRFLNNQDVRYQRKCSSEGIANAIRVEQGEFAVSSRTGSQTPPIGTHHVNPCVIICVTSNHHYGLAHFDSYRTPDSLDEFFAKFAGDDSLEIQIFGGKPGSDPLRTGTENGSAVIDYLKKKFPDLEPDINPPPEENNLNLVLNPNGVVNIKKFALGLNVQREDGAQMRMRHNVGGIVTAQQSRTQRYMPLNFIEAYTGSDDPVYLDRLSVKALEEFDARPFPGEEGGFTTDPGGFLLTEEMKRAHQLLTDEVAKQRLYMESELAKHVNDQNLREYLIRISPIYIGPQAEVENLKVVKVLEKLCSEPENNSEMVKAKALRMFNEASQYPLMNSLVPILEKQYKLQPGSLTRALNSQWGNINNLAYGVDVVAPNVVEIINTIKSEANPGLALTERLKTNAGTTRSLLTDLSRFYTIDRQTMLNDITAEFNRELAEENNVAKLISVLDQKNDVSRGNILQVLKNHYPTNRVRILERQLNSIWEGAKDPKSVLGELVAKVPPAQSFDWLNEYQELAKSFHTAHLNARLSEELEDLSFHNDQPGVEGVLGEIFKKAIVSVMNKNSAFSQDFQQSSVTCGELTRKIRDFIPYKKDTTALLELETDSTPELTTRN